MNARRIQVLFLLALTGLFAMVVAVTDAVLGHAVATSVAVGLTVCVVLASARARAAAAEARRAAGRTCTCCTSSHFDPVKVV